MADARRLHLHQHVAVPDGRHGYLEKLERSSHGYHADGFHGGECGFRGGSKSRSPAAAPAPARPPYSLMPPEVMPMTMYFWNTMAISTGGRLAITPPIAIIS